jgi:hypothetical protein
VPELAEEARRADAMMQAFKREIAEKTRTQ